MQITSLVLRSRGRIGAVAALVVAGILGVTALGPTSVEAGPKASKAWRSVAKRLRSSVKAEAKADYLLAIARASLLSGDAANDAVDEAKEEFKDTKDLAGDQYGARLELAIRMNESALPSVTIDPANFVAVVDHPYFPLTPGTERTYQVTTDEGVETIVVTVLAETKEILGVTCTVVRDTVSLDGELIEDTLDWYAQDVSGNVWYMGEIALNYEDGEITDIDGSWISGADGAQPGIIMKAAPAVGDIYRQEFLLGEAEDYAEVLALSETVTVAFGTYNNCLKTFDGTPMEPDHFEHKYYAQGIGVVLEVNPENGERVELINLTTN